MPWQAGVALGPSGGSGIEAREGDTKRVATRWLSIRHRKTQDEGRGSRVWSNMLDWSTNKGSGGGSSSNEGDPSRGRRGRGPPGSPGSLAASRTAKGTIPACCGIGGVGASNRASFPYTKVASTTETVVAIARSRGKETATGDEVPWTAGREGGRSGLLQ